jgi:drug/metabolite transporter (DMT)-like permease
LVAGSCFGVVLVLLSNIDTESGLWPIAAARFSAVAVLVVVLLSLGQFQRITRAQLPVLAACGILGVAGHAAVVAASGVGSVVIVGVLASLYPAATVSLARIVDREPLSKWQQIGLPLALASVAMLVAG